jgi:hypothetical protein
VAQGLGEVVELGGQLAGVGAAGRLVDGNGARKQRRRLRRPPRLRAHHPTHSRTISFITQSLKQAFISIGSQIQPNKNKKEKYIKKTNMNIKKRGIEKKRKSQITRVKSVRSSNHNRVARNNNMIIITILY